MGLSDGCPYVSTVGVCGDAGKDRAVCGSLRGSRVSVLCGVCVSGIHSQPHYWLNLQGSEVFEDYFVIDWCS